MAAVASPYGLLPVNLQGGQAFNGGAVREIAMTVNSATGFFNGDLVNITAGAPTPITATPTTTANGNTPVGVFVGCRYIDPVLKQLQFSNFLPAGAITAGYTQVWIRVVDDPDQLFMVQADGAVTRANIGSNSTLGGFSAGSTSTGKSAVKLLSAGIAGTNTLAVRIVDLVNNIATLPAGSAPGDAFTDCIIKFNQGVHAYYNATGQ